MVARVTAALVLRQVALANDNDLSRSHALLAELGMLCRAHYLRVVVDETDEDGEVVVPAGTTQRIGVQELRAWWLTHRDLMVEGHRELARHHLDACGVSA